MGPQGGLVQCELPALQIWLRRQEIGTCAVLVTMLLWWRVCLSAARIRDLAGPALSS